MNCRWDSRQLRESSLPPPRVRHPLDLRLLPELPQLLRESVRAWL